MAQKLSDFLKQHNLKMEDLEDDELGIPLPEVRKRLKDNQSAYTQETQRRADVERQLQQAQYAAQQHHGNAQQLQTYAQQLQAQLEDVQSRAQQVQRSIPAGTPQWRQDALYAPLIEEFDQIRGAIVHVNNVRDQEMRKTHEINQALARGIVTLSQEFANARSQVSDQFRQLHIERMKGRYTDFDEKGVQEYAQKHGVNDWDAAYTGWRGERMPSLIEAAKKEAREEALKEVSGRTSTPPTEMGTGSSSVGPVPEPKKDYESAWKGLENEFRELGIGGNA